MKKRSLQELNRASIEEYRQQAKQPIVVVLDSVRSAHNVGSIFRTADAMGIEKVVLAGITAQPPHREITKTAIGATQSVDWLYLEEISQVLLDYKAQGYEIVALEQTDNSIFLQDVQLTGPIVVIVGNEVSGVSDIALGYCDRALEIPQFGTKHSLNVAVSTGMVLWELIRLRID